MYFFMTVIYNMHCYFFYCIPANFIPKAVPVACLVVNIMKINTVYQRY